MRNAVGGGLAASFAHLLIDPVALTVGLFFGIYPARRAALLDPIEALRAEK